MRDQSAFYFSGAEPKAVHFEEIVGPAGLPEKSIFILTVFVAGAEPSFDERVLCFFGLIPVAGAERSESHLTQRSPISLVVTGRPDSSVIFAS